MHASPQPAGTIGTITVTILVYTFNNKYIESVRFFGRSRHASAQNRLNTPKTRVLTTGACPPIGRTRKSQQSRPGISRKLSPPAPMVLKLSGGGVTKN
jgi:hypothetical protein